MGLIKAFTGAVSGTLADQWKDIITAGEFDEHTLIAPGIYKQKNNGRGSNLYGSKMVISSGSQIFVPENTAAIILDKDGIEDVVTISGGYIYQTGEDSVFNGNGLGKAIFNQVIDRIGYGGQTSSQKHIIYVNLREIRNIPFETRGAIVYHDHFYDTDLEIHSFGNFSIKVTNPVLLMKNFIPPNAFSYSFDDPKVSEQLIGEFLSSYIAAINELSSEYRISQLPSQSAKIANKILSINTEAGSWQSRYGFVIVNIGIQNIELSEDSRELVKQYSYNKMSIKAYDDVSKRTADIAAQQKIAQGIQDRGFGDGSGMILGLNMAQQMSSSMNTINPEESLDAKIETLKKLKELLDIGILTQEEFDAKKKELIF